MNICSRLEREHTIPQVSPKSHRPLLSFVVPRTGLRIRWFGGINVANGERFSALVQHLRQRHWLTLLSGVNEVFVSLETERLCMFVSLVKFVPGDHHMSGALKAQSSSAYSNSTDEGWIPRNTVYCNIGREWCFLPDFDEWTVQCTSRVLSMAVDESVKCKFKSAEKARALIYGATHNFLDAVCTIVVRTVINFQVWVTFVLRGDFMYSL